MSVSKKKPATSNTVEVVNRKFSSVLTNVNTVTEKESQIMGNRFFGMLEKTAKKNGFGIEKSWDGAVYSIKVAIPQELRAAFKNQEHFITITIDMADLNKSLKELDDNATFTKGSPLRKRFFLEGYLQEIYSGVVEAISHMENGPGKNQKLLK